MMTSFVGDDDDDDDGVVRCMPLAVASSYNAYDNYVVNVGEFATI